MPARRRMAVRSGCGPLRSALLCVCLLAVWQAQATPGADAARDRESVYELLERAQNEVGRRATDLPRAWARIQSGLQQTRGQPLQHGRWLEVAWAYHLLNDDHARARAALEQALRCLTAAGADPAVIAGVSNDLSYSLILLGEVAQAKEHLRRAIVMLGQRNRSLLAQLYYGLGDAYRKTGQHRVAARYFQAAHELFVADGDAFKASAAELKLGSLARDAGDYAAAKRRHAAALLEFRRTANYRELVAEIELARDHLAQGALDGAQRHAQRALADGRALLEQRLDASILLLRISNEHRAAGHDTAADRARTAALLHRIEAMIARSAARQKSKLTRPTHQLQFAEQAIRHFAMNRDVARVKAHGVAAIRLVRNIAEDLRAAHDDRRAWLAEAQPVINAYVKALYELDRDQVFGLLETYYLQRAPASGSGASAVERAFEQQAIELFDAYIRSERSLLQAALELDRARSASAARLRAAERVLAQRQRARDLARDAYLASYRAAPAVASWGTSGAPAAPRTRPQLPASDILIRYFVQDDVSFGVALAGNELEYFDLPKRPEVLRLVRSSLDALQSPGEPATQRPILAALAQLLPRQLIRRHRDKTRLVIIADDAVQPLPFAAVDLADPSQPYAPLLHRFEIVRTRSAAHYYRQLRGTEAALFAPRASGEVVVFADPWPEGALRLPSARSEAASISGALRDHTVRIYMGRAATSEVLLSPAVRSATLLHLATHGYVNEAAPEIVGLATAGAAGGSQRFLGLADVFAVSYAARLVVISGCNTMRGKDYSGWGVRSLADGFLTQGAGSVIGTFWSVSDVTTAALMARFYRRLQRSGGNVSRALSGAQRELAALPTFADPFHWAGIALESSNYEFDQRAL